MTARKPRKRKPPTCPECGIQHEDPALTSKQMCENCISKLLDDGDDTEDDTMYFSDLRV